MTIHKGTPYFFLAENYLLVGDRDMAFLYLFNALVDDIKLGNWVPSMNYPQEAPAYLTITMKAGMQNQMYYFVDELRRQLDQYIHFFNLEYSKSFSVTEFDKKFLSNLYMKDVISFFVFNFVYLVESRKYRSSIQHTNEFDKLRNLDFIFNLCLIIDEILKHAELRNQGQVNSKHLISDGIKWLSGFRKWNLSPNDLEDFWGATNLNLNGTDPDIVIPRLLAKNESYKNKSVNRELHDLLIVYKLRNYGGHNIKQQTCFTIQFDQIIQSLLSSLFLSIEVL